MTSLLPCSRRPTSQFGVAVFDHAGFFVGRSGCFRMVFSIPKRDGTFIFARNEQTGGIQMSDPVCLVNEDQIVSVGEPSKLGAIGSPLSQKATFKLEYSLGRNNDTSAFHFRRRFWKRMNVEEMNLVMHSHRSSRCCFSCLLFAFCRFVFSPQPVLIFVFCF